ncbi:hypothetical protein MKX03_013895, partial [Papaver bracteatum]
TRKPPMENAAVAAPLGRQNQIRDVWPHFDMEEPPSKYVNCRHCNTRLVADPVMNGTAGLIAHLKRCRNFIRNNQL